MTHKIRIHHIHVLDPPLELQVHHLIPTSPTGISIVGKKIREDERRGKEDGGEKRTVGFRMILIEDM